MAIDLGNLIQSKEKREQAEQNQRVITSAKKLLDQLFQEQLQFNEAMGVCEMMRTTIAQMGTTWLNNRYLSHIKNELEEKK